MSLCLRAAAAPTARLGAPHSPSARPEAPRAPGTAGGPFSAAFPITLPGAAPARGRCTIARARRAVVVMAGSTQVLTFEGGMPVTPRFGSVNDVVMGGASDSRLVFDPTLKAAIFCGAVRTEGNGGFASVRSEECEFGVPEDAEGIELEVMGDGRQYKLNLKTDPGWGAPQWQHDFSAGAGPDFVTVRLPFSEFHATYLGKLVEASAPLRGPAILSVGLMVSKLTDMGGETEGFEAGAYELAVKNISYF